MRLFIAITFDPKFQEDVNLVIEQLRGYACRGNFTRRENLHLTLVFLGETAPARESAVKQAMDAVLHNPFALEFGGIGRFKRQDSAVYWMGTQQNAALLALYAQLCTQLRKRGFVVEERDFKPHLTLGREVILPDNFDMRAFQQNCAPMKIRVDKISLMKSERMNGRLIYTEIYARQLGGQKDVSQ